MTTHSQTGEFQGDTEDWPPNVERLECYFVANNMEESGKQRTILHSCCGAATYGLIWSLAAPRKPNDVSYQELVKRVTATSTYRDVARFKFNSCSLAASPVSARHIWQQTNNDPTLSKVRRFVQNGWPAQLPKPRNCNPSSTRDTN